MKFYIKYILLFVCITFFANSYSQSIKLDSLLDALKNENIDSSKVIILNKLSSELVAQDQVQAKRYALQALKIAEKHHYEKGIATSFHNLGNAYYYKNKIDTALEYYLRALDIRQKIDDKLGMASTLNNLGTIYTYYIGDINKALEFNKKSLKLNVDIGDKEGMATSYYNIGSLYENIGNYSEAFLNLNKGLELSIEIHYQKGQSACYNTIGIIYDKQGNYKKALENYLEGLKINEMLEDITAMALSYNNIGIISEKMGNLKDALNYYEKSLKLKEDIEDNLGIATVLNNIGNVYTEFAKEDSIYAQKALDNYTKSLNIAKEMHNGKIESDSYFNIASVFLKSGEFSKAIENYEKSLEIKEIIRDNRGIAAINIGIGECYFELSQYRKSILYLEKAYDFGKETNSLEQLKASANLLSLSYAAVRDYEKAYTYSSEQNLIIEELRNDENTKKITQLSMQYDFNKQQQQIEFAQKEKDLENQARINRQKVLIYSAAIVIVLMMLLTVVILRNARLMATKNTLLAKRKAEIEQKNKSITDSITYASKIQQALLPTDEFGENFISDHFILLKPKDIVSGDFYWIRQKSSKILVSAADCTGHGVPGALMSMLGISFLNDILNNTDIETIEANFVLNELREKVKKSLRQRGKENEAQDGMDMALCIIDMESYKLEYAGAYNPLYLIRDGELTRFKPDRMPIGIYVREKQSFTKYETQLQPGDTLYMFSDGYVDQFDELGENKFMTKPFKRLLLNIQDKNMLEQRHILEQTLNEWQGDSQQIDDILVMGLKIA